MEEEDGFICNVEMVRSDGTNEVIYLRKSGPLAPGDENPSLSSLAIAQFLQGP